MPRTIEPDYSQQFLLPPSLEEWVAADHPVRFVREFVESLSLEEMGFEKPEGEEGRPTYAPSLMVKIWLGGYLLRIRSSRKLEQACREQLSLLWLSGMIQPDHNSLWRFWRRHQEALRGVFKQTVQLAVRSGCVGLALQAVDGTKLAAACSNRTGWTKVQMEKLLAQLDEALAEVELQVVEANQEAAPGYRLPAGLTERKALRETIQAGLAQLAADERKHYHPVEPEAHRMKVGAEKRFAYNAQAVTDAKAGIITAEEVSGQENDVGQLVPMIAAAKENIGVATAATETLADRGYGAGADLQQAREQGLNVLAPPAEGTRSEDNPYAGRHFHYDEAARTVTCPLGQTLEHEGESTKHGQRIQRYRCRCHDCPVRAQCSRDPKGRHIDVYSHTPVVQAMRARLAEPATQAHYRRRAGIAEATFARIKQHDGFRRFTVWGLAAVRTQWSLLCAAANLRILHAHWRAALLSPTSPAASASRLVAA